jgi:hypothetical protein
MGKTWAGQGLCWDFYAMGKNPPNCHENVPRTFSKPTPQTLLLRRRAGETEIFTKNFQSS